MRKGNGMRRASRVLLTAVLLASAVSAPAARLEQAPTAETPPPASPPATAAPDPLQEFVPREKLKADSVVALPVDI